MAKPATREEAAAKTGQEALILRLRPAIDLTENQLLELSGLNRDLYLEMTAEGNLTIMPPAG